MLVTLFDLHNGDHFKWRGRIYRLVTIYRYGSAQVENLETNSYETFNAYHCVEKHYVDQDSPRLERTVTEGDAHPKSSEDGWRDFPPTTDADGYLSLYKGLRRV